MTVTPNFTPHMAKTVNAKIEKMRGCMMIIMMMSDGAMCIFYQIQDGMQPFRPAEADLDTDKKICCNGTPLYDATDGEVSAALPVLFGSVASP
jgi:hypothetical protein